LAGLDSAAEELGREPGVMGGRARGAGAGGAPHTMAVNNTIVTFDFRRPVALCLKSILHSAPGDGAYDLVAGMVARLAPGSMLMITQITADFDADLVNKVIEAISTTVTNSTARSRRGFARFFEHTKLRGPGIIPPPSGCPMRAALLFRGTRSTPGQPSDRSSGDCRGRITPSVRHTVTTSPANRASDMP
jgi:hypothetical protein